jgi:hypothetical protein
VQIGQKSVFISYFYSDKRRGFLQRQAAPTSREVGAAAAAAAGLSLARIATAA